ncbi:DNA methyltransferase [Leptolyngbya iicbica]|uniref:site-specific DNA-methyltransferase (cytosine-N(4)-specific) n=2 Tax=Cyanophyceae TaxID=3028117 RepID=A0A4Q7EHR9_9CYAN|nr:DNA methyltransferase [Leptolyngbya sp. LK]RZM82667.1 DNA methyltransferase [Leptolyngbya sp. LK]
MTASPISTNPEDLSNNKLQASDRAFHDWYRFVLSYPPHLVRHYIDRFGLGTDATVLDPFCGTGTTIVEAKKLGLASVGVEAVPMSQFACRTKVQWQVDLATVELARQQVTQAAVSRLDEMPLLGFTPEQQAIVVKNSICDRPLHQCLVLKQAIATVPDPTIKNLFNLALAYVTVHEASNLKFGPEVGIRRRKREEVPVLDCWQEKVNQMVQDLADYRHLATVSAQCHRGDARSLRSLLEPQSIDAIITSPPYPNEKDYTRTTRLESVLLGFLHNKQDLRDFKQSLIRSNTRNVYKVDDDDRVLTAESPVTYLADAIEARRLELQKTSGFERLYHRVTSLYFGGMKRHFQALQPALKPGAQLAYVVGDQASFFQIMIRTGELLEEIAAEVGYQVQGRDLFRTRVATATGAQLREEVVLLTWPGHPQQRQYFT